MYRDSPERLHMMDYCNKIEDFINYALSNLKNINGGGIRCLCKRCEIKKFLDLDVVMMHLLQKRIHREIPVLICTWRTICSLLDHGKKDGWVSF